MTDARELKTQSGRRAKKTPVGWSSGIIGHPSFRKAWSRRKRLWSSPRRVRVDLVGSMFRAPNKTLPLAKGSWRGFFPVSPRDQRRTLLNPPSDEGGRKKWETLQEEAREATRCGPKVRPTGGFEAMEIR